VGKYHGKKQETTIHITFQNVGGFAQAEDMDVKLEALRRFVTKRQIDIFGFSESNTCWDVLDESKRLARRTRGWWENSQWVLAHNRTEEQDTLYQPGGTGILCVNQIAHRAKQRLRPTYHFDVSTVHFKWTFIDISTTPTETCQDAKF